MQADLNTTTADPTDREVEHAREVAIGRGGKPLGAAHRATKQRFPLPAARRAMQEALAASETPPFKPTPDVDIQSGGCDRHHRIEVPYTDPDGEEGVAVLCITCDGLAATPDYGHYPRFES